MQSEAVAKLFWLETAAESRYNNQVTKLAAAETEAIRVLSAKPPIPFHEFVAVMETYKEAIQTLWALLLEMRDARIALDRARYGRLRANSAIRKTENEVTVMENNLRGDLERVRNMKSTRNS